MTSLDDFRFSDAYFKVGLKTLNGGSGMSAQAQPILPTNPKSENWRFFKRQFENYLLMQVTKKLPHLMNCLGRDGYTIYDGLANPKTTYTDAIARFDDYFKLHSSVLLRLL